LITGGEGLHNNHHGHPRSPKFSFRASEIDPAWPLIKLLIALKLAKPYKTIAEVAAA
jgi:stearoyl-CoA desaturase (delta-9 desaturase)